MVKRVFIVGSSSLSVLWIWFLPSNWFYVLDRAAGFTSGHWIDYLVPKLWVQSIVGLLVMGLLGCYFLVRSPRISRWGVILRKSMTSLLQARRLRVRLMVLLPSLCLFATLLWIQTAVWAGAQIALVATTGLMFGWWWSKTDESSKIFSKQRNVIVWATFATIVFQAGVAGYQYLQQQSLVGYALFGEVSLSAPFRIAREVAADGSLQTLGYGTTAHPNILATSLVVLWLWCLTNLQLSTLSTRTRWLVGVGATLCTLIGISSTHAVTGWVVATLAILLLVISRYSDQWSGWHSKLSRAGSLFHQKSPAGFAVRMSLVVLLIVSINQIIPWGLDYWHNAQLAATNESSTSMQRRVVLNQFADEQPISLTGTGLLSFSRILAAEPPRAIGNFIQPAHNVAKLWIVETGWVGVGAISTVLLYFVLYKTRALQTTLIWALVLIAPLSLDHFLLTNPTGIASGALMWSAINLLLNKYPKKDLWRGNNWR